MVAEQSVVEPCISRISIFANFQICQSILPTKHIDFQYKPDKI